MQPASPNCALDAQWVRDHLGLPVDSCTIAPIVCVPSGRSIALHHATMVFTPYHGVVEFDTLGGKPVVTVDGPVFPELAAARLMRQRHWNAVWADSRRRRFIEEWWPETIATISDEVLERVEAVSRYAGAYGGMFDLLAWRTDGGGELDIRFVGLKHRGMDVIRPTQIRWVAAALAIGLPIDRFLVLQWELRSPPADSA